MAFVAGFLPWVLYWILVGNAPFRLSVVAVLALALVVALVQWARGEPQRGLDRGSLVVFAVLATAAFVVPDPLLERWLQPLSNGGLFAVALLGVLIGRPFVREYAAAAVDEATARSDGFRVITTAMTWLWVVVFAAMTVSSLIPPIVDGAATILDENDLLSVVCYWVVPFTLVGAAGAVSALFPSWFERRTAMLDARGGDGAAPVAQPSGPVPGPRGSLRLEAPADSRHDQPFGLAVRGAPGGSRVLVSTEGTDLFGRAWRSAATFTASPAGTVDLATQAPDDGDWSAADADAPIWAMRFAEPDAVPEMFVPPVEPWALTLRAAVDGPGGGHGSTVVHRRRAAPGVRFCDLDLDGRPGLLALPAGAPPAGGWPAVACFGGSEGGYESQVPTIGVLASRGYAALAATWVSAEDAARLRHPAATDPHPPDDVIIAEIPLERFALAIRRLAEHETVNPSRIAATGISRGAEGLLAATCTTPGLPLRALVLVSPSSVAWQAVGPDGEIPDTGSWTVAGRPVPWCALPSGALMPQIVRNAWRVERAVREHRPSLLRLCPGYEAGLDRAASAGGNRAALAAETIDAPVLCVTGSDDQVWPSETMATTVLNRRTGGDRGVGDRHVRCAGAGHLIRPGVLPTDAPWTGGIAFGGTRDAQAAAEREFLDALVGFLHTTTDVAATDAPASPARPPRERAGT